MCWRSWVNTSCSTARRSASLRRGPSAVVLPRRVMGRLLLITLILVLSIAICGPQKGLSGEMCSHSWAPFQTGTPVDTSGPPPSKTGRLLLTQLGAFLAHHVSTARRPPSKTGSSVMDALSGGGGGDRAKGLSGVFWAVSLRGIFRPGLWAECLGGVNGPTAVEPTVETTVGLA